MCLFTPGMDRAINQRSNSTQAYFAAPEFEYWQELGFLGITEKPCLGDQPLESPVQFAGRATVSSHWLLFTKYTTAGRGLGSLLSLPFSLAGNVAFQRK